MVVVYDIVSTGKRDLGRIINRTRASAAGICLPTSSLFTHFLGRGRVPIATYGHVALLGDNHDGFRRLFRSVGGTRGCVRLRCFGFHDSSVTGRLFALLTRGTGRKIAVGTLFSSFKGLSGDHPLQGRRLGVLTREKIRVTHFDPVHFPCVGRMFYHSRRGVIIVSKGIKCAKNVGVTSCCVGKLPRVNP